MNAAEMILEFCKEPRTVQEICEHISNTPLKFGRSTQKTREGYLYPLIEKGLLAFTAQSKRSYYKKYVTVGYEETPIPSQANILDFCQVPRTRKEIREHFGLRVFKGSCNIAKLLAEGRLIGDRPHSPTHNFQKFISADSSELDEFQRFVCANGDAPKTTREAILSFCRTPKTRLEVEQEMGLKWSYMFGEYIVKFLKEGKIRFETPNKPKLKTQRYITIIDEE